MSRKFHPAVVISVATGRIFAPIRDTTDLVGYMVGHDMSPDHPGNTAETAESATRLCQAALLDNIPGMKEIDVDRAIALGPELQIPEWEKTFGQRTEVKTLAEYGVDVQKTIVNRRVSSLSM